MVGGRRTRSIQTPHGTAIAYPESRVEVKPGFQGKRASSWRIGLSPSQSLGVAEHYRHTGVHGRSDPRPHTPWAHWCWVARPVDGPAEYCHDSLEAAARAVVAREIREVAR